MSSPRYTIISQVNCGYCEKAKRLLEEKGLEYKELDVEPLKPFLQSLGLTTVPQVFEQDHVGIYHVGGYTDLIKWLEQYYN